MEHWRNGKQEQSSRRRQHTRLAHPPPPQQQQQRVYKPALRFDASDELFHGSDSAFADAEPSPSSQYTFTEQDGDTEEDELMRMIMEKERQEADAEEDLARAVAQANRAGRGQKEQRHRAPAPRHDHAVFNGDDFYSPVRPAESERAPPTEHAHAPFRVGRVVTHNRAPQPQPQQQRRWLQPPERGTRFANVGSAAADVDARGNDTDNVVIRGVGSNQMEHEPRQQQPQQRHARAPDLHAGQKKSAPQQRLQTADDVWDHFISGTSSDGPAVSPYPTADDHLHDGRAPPTSQRQQQLQRPARTNIFREEISVSTPLDECVSATADTFAPSIQRADKGRPQQQQSRDYSAESIPTVSYTPPMSPAGASSRWSSANGADRSRQSGATGSSGVSGLGSDDDPNGPHRRNGRDDDSVAASNAQLHHSSGHAVFPFWSVAFLATCALVGTSGFFVEDVLDVLGKFSSRASALSLSKDEQRQMHVRLEQLQSEIHGFRATASEIEAHSQRVFDEVKVHLSRMKREREKHQGVIVREMSDLRAYMLHVMSDMVEQERELIHARLKPAETAPAAVVDESDRASEAVDVGGRVSEAALNTGHGLSGIPIETLSNDNSDKSVASSRPSVVVQVEHQTIEMSPTLGIQPGPAVSVEAIGSAPAAGAAEVASSVATPALEQRVPLSKGESVMLLSWELLMMLTAMSILGGLVGIRVRNINRRKQWHEQRRARRELREQLERERVARMGDDESADEEEDDDVDGDTECSDETESRSGGEASAGDSDSDDDDGSNNSDANADDSAAESSGVETVSLMRLATGDTPTSNSGSSSRTKPRRTRLRAVSTDAEGDDDASDDNDDKRASDNNNNGSARDGMQTPQAKKTVRYSFMEDSPSRRRSPRLEGRVQQRR